MIWPSRERKDYLQGWWWTVSISLLLWTFVESEVLQSPIKTTAALLVSGATVAGVIRWAMKRYRSAHPFDLNICEGVFKPEHIDEYGEPRSFPLHIVGIEGLVRGSLTLHIVSKSEIEIKNIAVRFTKKESKSLIFSRYRDVSHDDIWVKELIDCGFVDAQEERGRNVEFSFEPGGAGGGIGNYKPAIAFPVGRILGIHVKYDVDPHIPKTTRELYLSVELTWGDNRVATVRRLMTFSNQPSNSEIFSTDQT